MRVVLALAGLALLIAASPVAGTRLNGTLAQSINTKTAYAGEPVTLVNVTSADGSGSIVGGKMYGRVTNVVHAGQGRAAKLEMTFTRLSVPSGASYAVDGQVTGVNAQTKSNALKEIGGALGGMLIGNAIGKTLFHASGFGFLGAVGGYLIAKNNRENMNVAQGSAVQVRLAAVRRQAH